MKILYVNDRLDPIKGGGTAERTRRLSAALARQGHQVTILTTTLGMRAGTEFSVPGVNVVTLKCWNERFSISALPFGMLRQLIREHDIIQLNGHWTSLNAATYFAARLEGKPYSVNPAGALLSFGRSGFIKSVYNAVAGHAMLRNANAHIAVTPSEYEQFAAYSIKSERVTVIPNGVDAKAFEAIDPSAFKAKYALGTAPLILFVGRLNLIKGPDLLLDAFASVAQKFPEHLLVFAGPDEGMQKKLTLAAQTQQIANRVRFIGYVGGDEKIAAYRAASLLVIPSRKEAMSIVVLEAGAAGTPVLITDQCGFDIVEAIGGGRVVKAEVDDIANGLTAMLSQVDQLADSGQKLCNMVRRDFTWDAAALRLSDLFEKIRAH